MATHNINLSSEKSSSKSTCSEDIRRSMRLMFDGPDEFREVFVKYPDQESLSKGKGRIGGDKYFGVFQRGDSDKLIAALQEHQDNWDAVYIGLHPTTATLTKGALARSGARSREEDIVGYRRLAFDFDRSKARREASGVKVNASDEDLILCRRQAEACRADLDSLGVTSALAQSGNGYHVIIAVCIPRDNKHTVVNVLAYMASLYSTDDVTVDTSLCDAARVIKLYGTVARKYPETAGRPHRISAIIDAPETLAPVSEEIIGRWVAQAPQPASAATTRQSGQNCVQGLEWDSLENEAAAVEYLKEAAPAVEGFGGDKRTFDVACGVADYGISEDTCLRLMEDIFNPRCVPPWEIHGSGQTLESKVRSAYSISRSELIGCKSPQYLREQSLKLLPDITDEKMTTDKQQTRLSFSKLGGTFDQRFAGKPAPKQAYLVERLLTGDPDLVLWIGAGGMGKTTLATQLARSVPFGYDFPLRGEGAPGRCTKAMISGRAIRAAFVGTEELDSHHHRRYERQSQAIPTLEGASSPILINLYGVSYEFFRVDRTAGVVPGKDWDGFRDYLKAEAVNLLIIDNLSDIFPGNENDRVQVSQFCKLMYQICQDLEMKVIVLAHTNKARSQSGSSGWENKVRQMLQTSAYGLRESRRFKTEVLKANGETLGEAIYTVFDRETGCHRAISEETFAGMSAADKDTGIDQEQQQEAEKAVLAELENKKTAMSAGALRKLKGSKGVSLGTKAVDAAIAALLFDNAIVREDVPPARRAKDGPKTIEGYRLSTSVSE